MENLAYKKWLPVLGQLRPSFMSISLPVIVKASEEIVQLHIHIITTFLSLKKIDSYSDFAFPPRGCNTLI